MRKIYLLVILFAALLLSACGGGNSVLNDLDHQDTVAVGVIDNVSGIQLLRFESSQCDHSLDPLRVRTRISGKAWQHDTLWIEIARKDYCCVTFSGGAHYHNDTLALILKSSGNRCSCFCAYKHRYALTGFSDTTPVILFNFIPVEFSSEPYYTYPVSYEILKGDTINFKDKYGFEQGVWKQFYTDSTLESIAYFMDGTDTMRKTFDKTGALESEFVLNQYKRFFNADGGIEKEERYKKDTLIEYYFFPDGRVSKVCKNWTREEMGVYKNYFKCTTFNKDGEVIAAY